MRIGIMLRSIDEKGGVGVYTRNIVKELLERDLENQYVLLYANRSNMGLFSDRQNVKERWVRGRNKAYWDQIAIPLVCQKEKIDVIFHPKFTVPIFAPCKRVMVVHGADWLIPEQARYYSYWDVIYMKFMLPIYVRKSSAVISVSQGTTDDFLRVLRGSADKIQTIYFAPARHFRCIADAEVLSRVQARYNLPHRFIFTLTKRAGADRKNLGQIFAAYRHYHQDVTDPYSLVIGGKDCHLFRREYGVPDDGYGRDIHFPGWIEQADMPAVFSLASLYLYPSNLEAFPIPLTEAMACGTPILTSDVNGLREIAGDAALFVDPGNAEAIAKGIQQILSDPDMRQSLSCKGLERSRLFSWDICARRTLSLIESAAAG